MTSIRKSIRLVTAAALLAGAAPAMAAFTNGNLTINGTVIASCTFTTTAVDFGANIPSPLAANVDATGTIVATCSNTIPYTISMNAGGGTGATMAVRKLTSGANTLNYSLYTTAARTVVWGDGTLGTGTTTVTGNALPQTTTVYGRIPTGQAPALGAYTDTVTVTLTF